MKNLLAISLLMFAVSANASWYGPYYGNAVNAGGTADSSANTSGSTSNHGTGYKEANSGAFNSSTASATANFANTRGVSKVHTSGVDITKVLTKFSGQESDSSFGNTQFHSYGTNDGTQEQASNQSQYQGFNLFASITKFSNNSITNYATKTVGLTTDASTVGGSFGKTLGYGSKTNSSYAGKANAWGNFRLNSYGR